MLPEAAKGETIEMISGETEIWPVRMVRAKIDIGHVSEN
jgi:hypothetical protein